MPSAWTRARSAARSLVLCPAGMFRVRSIRVTIAWTGSARKRWPASLAQIERLTARAADMLAAETATDVLIPHGLCERAAGRFDPSVILRTIPDPASEARYWRKLN